MCDFIGSACLMANLFVTCEEESFSLHEVRSIGNAVQKRLSKENVMVVWTRPSVLATFHDYNDMFVKRDRMVFRAEESKDLFNDDFVNEEFNHDLPESVVSGMREAIHEFITSV